jgi:hypothetical protein
MSETDSLHGLSCPRCGGMVPIPEGQVIVHCPFCEQRSLVRGERGLQRYQVPRRVAREQAVTALQGFLRSHGAIARDALKRSEVSEAMLVYLPFWASWARALGWVFGQKRERHGENTTYKPREVRVVQDMNWNGAACDVGEFGVTSIPLGAQPLEAFDADALHDSGLVFEPVGSASDARTAAETDFNQRLERSAGLDRIAQVFARFVRQRFGLVYYPLWVMRYVYRQRSFQVVVDGFSGQVLYGKAPGNTLYRAAMLVGGMAIGAFLAVDASALAWYLASQTRGDSAGGLVIAGLAAVVIGFGLMGVAYRTFRYGEQYEYRSGPKKGALNLGAGKDILKQVEEVTSWFDQ